MSEKILKALMELFAIIAGAEKHLAWTGDLWYCPFWAGSSTRIW